MQEFIVIRVPQEEFFTAQERLAVLGELLGSQDVTEQFVDLEARLRSLQTEEIHLLDLLDRAGLDVRDDETSATITIRLTRADFDAGITSIENLGDVRRKTLREGGDEIFPRLPESVVVRDPDARVLIFLSGDGDGSDTALIASLAGIFGTLGGLVLILAAYRYGRCHCDE